MSASLAVHDTIVRAANEARGGYVFPRTGGDYVRRRFRPGV